TKDHPENPERLDNPQGVTVARDGSIYFTDFAKDVIRKIGKDGKMTVFAGDGNPGSKDGKGTSASFYLPEGIASDNKGNLYVADCYNNTIRKIDAGGMVTTLAGKPAKPGKHNKGSADGKGPAASFSHPCGIAVDGNGNVYVADVGNNKIRKITPDGTVTTVAGTGLPGAANGDALQASFYKPFGVAVDNAGNVYIADYQNNLIRKLNF
ncbi:MAG TPA: SMP-30/gluconolactonase/LRE family protein, partial [Mucilaginibacter sp.]|nr:SMP-30/gluconolactonase/LRE family protein [Mucilaginibacter sp.]